MYVILVYDMNTEDKKGRRRLQKIFKLCKKYLVPVQRSVFEGEITKFKLASLKLQIQNLINEKHDAVIIFNSRKVKWLQKDMLGIQPDANDPFI